MGRAALHFRSGDPADRRARLRMGLLLCIWPYIAINLLASALVLATPLDLAGALFTLMAFWLGNSGFIWAYVIEFVCRPYKGPFADETPLPETVNIAWTVGVVVAVAAALCVLVPGLKLGWHL
jgi:hypothetical protein